MTRSSEPPVTTSIAGSETPKAMRTETAVDSDVLLIAFGSMRPGFEVVPFEYESILRDIPAKKIYVRDLLQYWYQRGLPGVADSLAGVGDHLGSLTASQSPRKVVTFGGSMGGYAALYFGWHIGADEVHAFAPKTFLTPLRRMIYGDFRRKGGVFRNPVNQKIVSLWLDRKVDKKFLDLKKVLSSGNNKSTYYLYYNRPFRKDRIHAERMRGLPGVELIPYENKGHQVSKDLRDSGALDRIIRGAL